MTVPVSDNVISIVESIMNAKKFNSALDTELFQKLEGADEVDFITNQREQFLEMRLKKRNEKFQKKLDGALYKIQDGTFGCCDECGVQISPERLKARPTAEFCINCQEEKEMTERNLFHKRRDLHLKQIEEHSEDLMA